MTWLARLWTPLLALFLLTWSTQYPAITAPNERTRIYLAVALVDHGTLSIDEPSARFGPVLDAARRDGRLYTDKAPGSSLLAAVAYGLCRLFSEPQDWSIQGLLQLCRRGVMVPLGLLGFLALGRLLRKTGVSRGLAELAATGWLLGSSAFHYSTAFYGHQIVAVALLLSLLAIEEAERASGRWRAALHAGLAGAAAGFAGLTEYQAGIPCLLLALHVLLGPLRRSWLTLSSFAAGALPALVALGTYNTLAFGGPLELSYHHLADPGLSGIHGVGVGGVTLPSWEGFAGSLFSLHRGLLATSPCFLFALPGAVVLWKRGRRRLAVLASGALAGFVLFVSSSNMWVAGWGFGPRLLVPVMPWAMLLVAHGAQRLSRLPALEGLWRGTLVVGVAQHQLVHATFPEPPVEALNPLVDVAWPLLARGVFAPTLASELWGVIGPWAAAPALGLAGVVLAGLLVLRPTAGGLLRRLAVAGVGLACLGAFVALVVLVGTSEVWHLGGGLERVVLGIAR